MSSQSSVNLSIECQLSPRLALLFAGLFGGAVSGICLAGISVLLKMVCCATLAPAVIIVFRHYILLLSPDSIVGLTCSAEQWTIHTRHGKSMRARLVTAAFWVFEIVPLVFETADGERRSVLLTRDGAQQEPLRRLRAWIRHRMPAA